MDPRCSFCGNQPVVAWFEGPTFMSFVRSAEDVRSDEAWLACASCLELVQAGDRERIARRGTLRVGGSAPDEVLVSVRDSHDRFWSARTERKGTWNEAFADRYDEWVASVTDDVDFYQELALEADGPLVELAIGSGRVAIPVAQATGRTVIGIDSSPSMLEQARVRAMGAGVDLDLREGDMRDLSLDEPAALIYCPINALMNIPTWVDRRRMGAFDRRPVDDQSRSYIFIARHG